MSERLRFVFQGRGQLAVHIALLRAWRTELESLLKKPFGMHIDPRVIDRAIDVIAVEIMHNAPAYECWCDRNPDCRCLGLEWLTQHQVEMVTNRDPEPLCVESSSEPPN